MIQIIIQIYKNNTILKYKVKYQNKIYKNKILIIYLQYNLYNITQNFHIYYYNNNKNNKVKRIAKIIQIIITQIVIIIR